MTAIIGDPVGTLARSGHRGVLEFAQVAGLKLEPFQKRIIRAVLGPQAETLILLPRGAGKTTLMGLLVVHHLITVEHAKVYVAASSRAPSLPPVGTGDSRGGALPVFSAVRLLCR